ncbi:MAG: Coenzyme F420 hydrogenase/dehydrogenase, beta subunit C-terminal domain, partial [Peptococcaceae bacterium]|nr:Coenzyme F420 hydrogenase/dehydrogenase, beta subunit C-terminal domain [Peptococcaceae bacterium]
YTSIHFARAKDEKIRARGQYGGVVTALFLYAVQQGQIDCALMAGGGPAGAKPSLCSLPGEILETAGSKYTAVPTLSLFQEAVRKGFRQIGVAGRPCQVAASRKMQQLQEINGQRIALVIGLFCFWALSAEFYPFLEKKGLHHCTRMDIPRDGVFFQMEDGARVNLPLEEIRPFIKNACLACYDPLSELADLSVGSTEHDPGWNTLVVRSSKGRRLAEEAAAAGVVELKPYPPELLPVLRQAVFQKKKRVLERPDAAYIGVPPGERSFFLEGGGAQ